ncbi:MAG: hypothetical protein H0W15_08105, partial [Gemmatimonadales bacterium]|nr:hypothetical protein [Gemmatimonadales bacterium]
MIMMLGVACSHSPTTATVPYTPDDAPFTATTPIRLTYDPGIDAFASFSPDGATMLYAFQPRDRDDHDRCIGFMPAGGGSREEHCDNTGIGAARTDALEYPALNNRGDLLYARYASAIGDFIPNTAEISLQLATRDAPLAARNILQLPMLVEGVGLTRIGRIRWASDDVLYFAAEEMTLLRNPISTSFRDTVVTGNGLIRGTRMASGFRFETVGGILDASDFDFSVGRDTIFFTRSRGNRLYAVATDGTVGSVVYSAPQSPGRPRQLRSPARVGRLVVAALQDIDRSEPPLYPAGLAAGASLQLIETRNGTATTPQEASVVVPSFGRVATMPGSCRIVVEFRHRQSVSFTT